MREQDIAESIEPLREECARFEAQCHLEESAATELQSQHAAVASELPYHARGKNHKVHQFHNGLLFLSRTPIDEYELKRKLNFTY